MLTKESIQKSNDLRTKEIDIPEWGGKAYIRELSEYMNARYLSICIGKKEDLDLTQINSILIAMSLCDKNGVLIFDPNNPEDLAIIDGKSNNVTERVFNEIESFNEMDKKRQANEFEEAEKNS